MLLNDFYFIERLERDGNSARATVMLNLSHKIFNGHFPGRPILPGACLLQMVEEMIAVILDRPCRLSNAEQLKFIVPIDPQATTGLAMTLNWQETPDQQWRVLADLSADAVICFKFSGVFQPA